WPRLFMHWGIVYVGNFIGAATMIVLCWFGGSWEQAGGRWGKVILDTSMSKLEHSFVEAFFLGIACNLLVCLAVWVAFAGRTITDKVLAVTGPIALFVAAGFEHSVANMFMVPFGILIKDLAPAEYWAELGGAQADYALLDWGQFFAGNLLPVTLGHIIGGGIMIGAYYWRIFRPGKKHALTPRPVTALGSAPGRRRAEADEPHRVEDDDEHAYLVYEHPDRHAHDVEGDSCQQHGDRAEGDDGVLDHVAHRRLRQRDRVGELIEPVRHE